jgi:hypothetical protein
MDTNINWQAVKQDMETSDWQELEPGREERSVFLGTCFALAPSGKYYQPWACGNVTEKEAELDEKYYEALEAEANDHGYAITSGEGDPCDIFASECHDIET